MDPFEVAGNFQLFELREQLHSPGEPRSGLGKVAREARSEGVRGLRRLIDICRGGTQVLVRAREAAEGRLAKLVLQPEVIALTLG